MARKAKTRQIRSAARPGGVTRRTLLKGIGAGVAAGAAARGMGPFIRNARAASQSLRVLMWEPYNVAETVKEFEKATGGKFSPTFFDGNSEAFNKMKAGGTKDFDLVQADGFWPRLYYKQGLIQEVDYGRLPSLKDAFADFLPPNYKLFRAEGGDAMVAAPNCWGGYGVTINASKITDEEAGTLNVMFNEKFKGHLSTSARFEENIAMAGILAAHNMGTQGAARPDGKPFNPYVLTDAELEEAKKLLIKQKGLLLTRYQDYDTLDRLMRTGAVWASPEFSETYRRLYRLRKEGKIDFDVKHVLKPEEGGLGWVDSWMISSGVEDSEKLDLAYAWIDHFLSKESMIRVVNEVGVPPITDVRDMMSAEEVELFLMNDTDQVAQLHMFDQPSSPEKWERIWSEVEAA